MTNYVTHKGNKQMRYLLKTGIAILSLSLAGCGGIDMYKSGTMNDTHIQVKEQSFSDDVAISEANEEYLSALAYHYNKYGDGVVDLVVAYDPHSYRNTAMNATNAVSDIAQNLRENGVRDINARIIPIQTLGDEARVQIAYNSFTAQAPDGCDEMLPGMNGTALEHNPHYKMGCSVDTLIARQVAKPKHLIGRGAADHDTDGRAAANIVDVYRSGVKNEPLDGETASEGN